MQSTEEKKILKVPMFRKAMAPLLLQLEQLNREILEPLHAQAVEKSGTMSTLLSKLEAKPRTIISSTNAGGKNW